MKPTTVRKKMLYLAPMHLVNKQLAAPLSKELREKYHKRSVRVKEGDSVKVLRGEFKGIEGKVTNVSTERRGVAVEGIKREKLKGGNVDIYISASNVIITSLNLEDKWRQNRLEGKKSPSKEKSGDVKKEILEKKEVKATKEVEKIERKEIETESVKQKKSEK